MLIFIVETTITFYNNKLSIILDYIRRLLDNCPIENLEPKVICENTKILPLLSSSMISPTASTEITVETVDVVPSTSTAIPIPVAIPSTSTTILEEIVPTTSAAIPEETVDAIPISIYIKEEETNYI